MAELPIAAYDSAIAITLRSVFLSPSRCATAGRQTERSHASAHSTLCRSRLTRHSGRSLAFVYS